MHVEKLQVRDFRNISLARWSPSPRLNLLWGDNGEGKTNLLEALHFVLTGRSFRTHRDNEALPWNWHPTPDHATSIDVRMRGERGDWVLRMALSQKSKRIFRDGQLIHRLGELMAETAVVTFIPEEAGLFKAPPAVRRRFLDQLLCYLSPAYMDHLRRYKQALQQVNAVLKTMKTRRQPIGDSLEPWLPGLAESGAAVLRERHLRLKSVTETLQIRFEELGGRGQLDLHIDTSIGSAASQNTTAEDVTRAIKVHLERARKDGSLPIGPHRDDFTLRLNGQDLRRFGSQGQHRLTALALKLETAQWIAIARGETPILLLDDFGSELDPQRRKAVLTGLRDYCQVFVTATSLDDLGGPTMFDEIRHVRGGEILT